MEVKNEMKPFVVQFHPKTDLEGEDSKQVKNVLEVETKTQKPFDEEVAELKIDVNPKAECEPEVPVPYSEEELKERIVGDWSYTNKLDVVITIDDNEIDVSWKTRNSSQSFPFGEAIERRQAFFENNKLVTVQYDKFNEEREHYRREWYFEGDNLISKCPISWKQDYIFRRFISN